MGMVDICPVLSSNVSPAFNKRRQGGCIAGGSLGRHAASMPGPMRGRPFSTGINAKRLLYHVMIAISWRRAGTNAGEVEGFWVDQSGQKQAWERSRRRQSPTFVSRLREKVRSNGLQDCVGWKNTFGL